MVSSLTFLLVRSVCMVFVRNLYLVQVGFFRMELQFVLLFRVDWVSITIVKLSSEMMLRSKLFDLLVDLPELFYRLSKSSQFRSSLAVAVNEKS